MKGLITICARGGSQGVPRKNIRLVNGKPLIQYTIDIAKKFNQDVRIVCSTDSADIIKLVNEFGIDTPFVRSASLSNNKCGKVEVIRDCFMRCEDIYHEEYDYVMDLDVTNPLRTIKDLENAFDIYNKSTPEILFSVTSSHKNPYFNMVEMDKSGNIQLVKNAGMYSRRQDVPKVYSMNASIYIYSRDFMLDKNKLSPLSSDKISIYEMNAKSAVDIDSIDDLEYVEYLIKRGFFENE